MRLSNYDIHIFDTIYFILKCSETKEKRELDRKAGLGHVNRTFGHVSVESQEPHSQILIMEGGGGSNRGSYFIPKKDHNFSICLPKKITTFLSIPKKIPWFSFCNPKKSLRFFRDPKKSWHLS